jgi:hypothetical protein
VPPVAESDCEYAIPTAPFGSEVVVIPGGSGLTVIENTLMALPLPLSVNRTVKADKPRAEGVPLMTPVDAAKLNPCGKLPSDIAHETGETAPDAVRVAEYGEPAVAFGNDAVVIEGVELLMVICRA